MSKLSGKIAVVTGSTGGLGAAVVERLLSEGAEVLAVHSEKSSPETVTRNPSRHLSFHAVDVTKQQSVDDFYDRVLNDFPSIDILCNLVGGVQKKKMIEQTTFEEWEGMFRLNLHSCFLMMRRAIPPMKVSGFGRIINIAAMPAIVPEAMRAGYGASKAAVIALTRSVSEEMRQYPNITVNAIAPGIIDTEANREWGTVEERKKWVTPEQIAEMMAYLCSDNGTAMNGQTIQMYGKV